MFANIIPEKSAKHFFGGFFGWFFLLVHAYVGVQKIMRNYAIFGCSN